MSNSWCNHYRCESSEFKFTDVRVQKGDNHYRCESSELKFTDVRVQKGELRTLTSVMALNCGSELSHATLTSVSVPNWSELNSHICKCPELVRTELSHL